jgi:polyisoprenoid-binding protein YceI
MPLDPMGARAGFSLETTIKRSDFGISFGIPEAGSKMGVGDEVQIFVETEMSNPDALKPQP